MAQHAHSHAHSTPLAESDHSLTSCARSLSRMAPLRTTHATIDPSGAIGGSLNAHTIIALLAWRRARARITRRMHAC
jgi:hypothetical protein